MEDTPKAIRSRRKVKVFEPPTSDPPSIVVDRSDKGDETGRNFRYQYSYGAVLAIASITGNLPYVSIWCEHHDDFLCLRSDDLYDAYQIKTSQPESGYWDLNDDALKSSIKKFAILNARFPGRFSRFVFVSNTAVLDTNDEQKLYRSPRRVIDQIGISDSLGNLPEYCQKALKVLSEYCGCDQADLFQLLKITVLFRGPDRESFETVVSHQHITTLDGWANRPAIDLNALRDELIEKVSGASSLRVEDPRNHYYCLVDGRPFDARLASKMLTIESLRVLIAERTVIAFRYVPGVKYIELGSLNKDLINVIQKLTKAQLVDQVDSLCHRATSAEAFLMELSVKDPEKYQAIVASLEGTVKSICDEARLAARVSGEPTYGPKMMLAIYEGLKEVVKNSPSKVYHIDYDCLVGMVGILGGRCKVWWSDEFILKDAI